MSWLKHEENRKPENTQPLSRVSRTPSEPGMAIWRISVALLSFWQFMVLRILTDSMRMDTMELVQGEAGCRMRPTAR